MRRRNVILVLLCLGIVVAGFVLWRDLSLPERARETAKTQVLIQNLELEREISGDIFRIRAMEARKMQDERIEASSLDVRASLSGGGQWQLKAVSGSLEPGGEIRLSSVFASKPGKGMNLDITAKEALWNPEQRQWDFEEGVLLRQGILSAGANRGMADPSGRVTLLGEAWATWEKH